MPRPYALWQLSLVLLVSKGLVEKYRYDDIAADVLAAGQTPTLTAAE
jgi:hypothetical protein